MPAPYVRLYDFTPGQRVRSGEVDDELNAVVEAFLKVTTGFHDVGIATHPGTVNDIILTHDPPRTTVYASGDRIVWLAVATSTSAVTVNVDGLGVKDIYSRLNTGYIGAGAYVSGGFYEARYNGTRFLMVTADS